VRIFLKWTGRSFLYLLAFVSLSILFSKQGKVYWKEGAIAVVAGSLFLGALYYFLEAVYYPWRKEKLADRLIGLFSARPVSPHTAHFRIANFDIYTEINYDPKVAGDTSYGELIRFHIPMHQLMAYDDTGFLKYRIGYINGMDSCIVYEGDGLNLRKLRKGLEKEMTAITGLPLVS
jgi:hypothetical protein